MSNSHTAYRQTVNSYADDIMERVRNGETDVHDMIHEACDGSYWVIYTHAARKVIEYSDNDHAYFDEVGAITGHDWSSLFCTAAYFAMRADVWDVLSDRGFDEDDPDTWDNDES